MFVKEGGRWRDIKQVMAKHNGIWKPTIPWVKQNGRWHKLSTGKFIYIGYGNELTQFDEDFNELWSVTTPDLKISSMAEDYKGNIIIGTYSNELGDRPASLVKYNSNGKQIWSKTTDRGVSDLDVDTDNNIYVAIRSEYIKKYSPTGSLIKNIGDGSTYKLLIFDNYLYSASSSEQYVTLWKHDLDGNAIWNKKDDYWRFGVNALEIDEEQNLYLGSGGRLLQIPEDKNRHSWYREHDSYIKDIKTDKDLLFVTTNYEGASRKEGIYCHKVADGSLLWRDEEKGWRIRAIDVDKENKLVYVIRTDKLLIYDYQGSIIKENDNYQGDTIYLGGD